MEFVVTGKSCGNYFPGVSPVFVDIKIQSSRAGKLTLIRYPGNKVPSLKPE
jgi:hypothetical protein